MIPVITIDGPAGVGKSTVACRLAKHLGYQILVSGALYRTLAIFSLWHKIDIDDYRKLLPLIPEIKIRFEIIEDEVRMFLADKDVTENLGDEACANCASMLAKIPEIRSALLACQRSFQNPPGLIAEGRDMGTVVFPNAQTKIFLTATIEERAKRRYKQLGSKQSNKPLKQLSQLITERDQRDVNRSVAPLKVAKDAIVIDTNNQSVQEVVNKIIALSHQLSMLE